MIQYNLQLLITVFLYNYVFSYIIYIFPSKGLFLYHPTHPRLMHKPAHESGSLPKSFQIINRITLCAFVVDIILNFLTGYLANDIEIMQTKEVGQ